MFFMKKFRFPRYTSNRGRDLAISLATFHGKIAFAKLPNQLFNKNKHYSFVIYTKMPKSVDLRCLPHCEKVIVFQNKSDSFTIIQESLFFIEKLTSQISRKLNLFRFQFFEFFKEKQNAILGLHVCTKRSW